MDNFVVYHNPETMGYDARAVSDFSIVTSKPVVSVVGQRVWLITGRGHPRSYSLVLTFIANTVFESSGMNGLRGEVGTRFSPEVSLDRLPWFPAFRAANGNFGFGLQRLKDPNLVDKLNALLETHSDSLKRPIRRRAAE